MRKSLLATAVAGTVCVGAYILLKSAPRRTGTNEIETSKTYAELSSTKPSEGFTTPTLKHPEQVAKVLAALQTPINLLGRIVDQNGQPVPEGQVRYTATDRFDAKGSDYKLVGAKDGTFTISGIKGAVLLVSVSKKGYRQIAGESDAAFAFGIGSDATRRRPPAGVVEFRLRKAGEIAPLLHVSSRQITVPSDGQSISVNLEDGKTGPPGRGHLELTATVGEASARPFDWDFPITVPNGGLVERASQFDFIAPDEGYVGSAQKGSSKNENGNWSSRKNGDFFIRLPDNRYGRLRFRFHGGPRMYVVLESYINTKPGDRNTESPP